MNFSEESPTSSNSLSSSLSDLGVDFELNFNITDNTTIEDNNITKTNKNILINNNSNNNNSNSSSNSKNINNNNFNFINQKNELLDLNEPETIKNIASGNYANSRQAKKIINQDASFLETVGLMINIFSKSKGLNPPPYKYSKTQIITEKYGEQIIQTNKQKKID